MAHRPSHAALKAFEALVRCGSIHRAAEDIHISPGAVSQQIRKLEATLETALFDRSGRSMTPTPTAKKLAAELNGAFKTVDAALDQVRDSAQAVQLRIATLPSVATRIVLPNLVHFKESAPQVQLSFTYVHRLDDTKFWDADVLICAVDYEFLGEGVARDLFSGAVRPFASKAFVATNGPFKTDLDITRSHLLHDFSATGWIKWMEGCKEKPDVSVGGDTFEDFELLIHSVLADQGIALCPPPLIVNEIKSGRLTPVSDRAVFEARKYVVVTSEDAKPEAKSFADWLIAVAQDFEKAASL